MSFDGSALPNRVPSQQIYPPATLTSGGISAARRLAALGVLSNATGGRVRQFLWLRRTGLAVVQGLCEAVQQREPALDRIG